MGRAARLTAINTLAIRRNNPLEGLQSDTTELARTAAAASGRNAGFIWLSLRAAGAQLALAKAGLALYSI